MTPTGEILEHQPEQMSPGAAAHVMAMRAAEGAGVSQSWIAALDHLQRSAELGFRPAQAELAALAGEWNLPQQIDAVQEQRNAEGARLRHAGDLHGWVAQRAHRRVHAN